MMRILLVDDENAALNDIIAYVHWPDYGMEIAAVAENGLQALDELSTQPIDLLLSDIRIPVMSGIELVRQVRDLHPDIRIVILSGYDDIQFAMEAMAIGIRHYLLKPVAKERLISVLSDIRNELREQQLLRQDEYIRSRLFNENLPLIKSGLMQNLLQNTDLPDLMQKAGTLQIRLDGPLYEIFIVAVDDFAELTSARSQKEADALLFAIFNIAEETLASHYKGFIGYGTPGMLIGLVNIEPQASIRGMLEELQANLMRFIKVSVSIAVGSVCDSLTSAGTSFESAEQAMRFKAFQGKGKILMEPCQMEAKAERNDSPLDFSKFEKLLVHAVKNMEKDEIDRTVGLYFKHFISKVLTFETVKGCCVRLLIALMQALEDNHVNPLHIFPASFLPHLEVEKYEVIEDLRAWVLEWTGRVAEAISEDEQHSGNRIVKEALKYIAMHYAEPIALTEAAEHVHVTPSHFSKLFKEETGMTFNKYLNKYRIGEACRLLKHSWLKTYEIAAVVGYQDYKYFSIMFKKVTGTTPREYRNQSE